MVVEEEAVVKEKDNEQQREGEEDAKEGGRVKGGSIPLEKKGGSGIYERIRI